MVSSDYYWIYILAVRNGKLYTGYTNNIIRRYLEHRKGTGASKFTRAFKAEKLLQCWRIYENVGTLLKIEAIIKKQPRQKKLALVKKPGQLKQLVKKHAGAKLRIYTFSLQRVRKAATKQTLYSIRKTGDLFVHFPEKDL